MEQNNYMRTGTLHVTSLENCGYTSLLGGLERLKRIVIYLRTGSLLPEVHLLIKEC